jgi:Cu+-exporting ATPase
VIEKFTVVLGDSTFDESSLTRESRPITKNAGDQVFAGTVNTGKPISVRVTEISGSSMLDQIVKVVREGQTKRAPVERVANILTGYFVPIVTRIAISTFVIWFGLGQGGVLPESWRDVDTGGWAFWALQFAIAIFVGACPCGIALAAPTALFVGSGLAAQHGILVKGGGEAFQEASALDVVVFDKTGTLTEGGNPSITNHDIIASNEEEAKVI